MKKTPKILAFHLYNDYSGSPKVLGQLLDIFVKNNFEVEIYTSKDDGMLSDKNGVSYFQYTYHPSTTKWVTLLKYLLVQFKLFWYVIRRYRKNSIVYVNTLLPFGAALAAKLTGKKVIYHLHETSIRPELLKRFLLWVVRICASEVIYVSQFLKEQDPIKVSSSHVIYNALDKTFTEKARKSSEIPIRKNNFSVLMACSLKDYKGVKEFVKIATTLPVFQFDLVLNATQKEIDTYFNQLEIPRNLILYSSQKDLHQFYLNSSVVVNLSKPKEWIETFGMTLLEAMNYRLPVICPPIGGPTEIVIEDYNGYCIDSNDIHAVVAKLTDIYNHKEKHAELKQNALKQAIRFDIRQQEKQIIALLTSKAIPKKQTSVSNWEKQGIKAS